MRFRPAPLRAAAALAAGFIVVRIVYRILFHGADGAGPVLLALPGWRLPPPFSHVTLLGEVTAGGLLDAVISALPVAITILAFGLLNSFIDLPRLLARASRRGPLQGIARTLAVAWAALPALVDAVRAVRLAQRLRGERGGVRLLTPVLERTLERATAVAAALELRGLAGRGLEGDCEHPVVVADAVARHRDGATGVRVPELTLATGSLTLVTGATGSGKSTLLRALAGLHAHLDGGSLSGRFEVVGWDRTAVPPRDTARLVGVVLQSPRDGFATERVADEIGLALELRGVASVLVAARVAEVAERVGITELLARSLRGLSAGEATLVAIAAALVERPILLLVDEPLADLDAGFRARIVGLLDALAHEAGVCVVVAEHRAVELAHIADRRIIVADGVVADGVVAEEGEPRAADAAAPTAGAAPAGPRTVGAAVLEARAVTVRRGTTMAVDDVSLWLGAGEIAAVVGPNGAGKSTLLAELALPAAGQAVVGERVALVPDASDDLFLCETVEAECARADRRGRLARGTTATRLAGFLGVEADEFATRHPRDLSAGQRRCLAIAVQLAAAPRVLLVDEATRGLDADSRALVARTLVQLADDGAAVLISSHDPEFAASLGARIIALEAGRVVPAPPVAVSSAAVGGRPAVRLLRGDAAPTPRPAPVAAPPPARSASARRGAEHPGPSRLPARIALVVANLVALASFTWPLVAYAVPSQATASVPAAALALAPLAALVVLATLDRSVRSAHTLALLGTLAAIGAAIRIVGTGVGGVEAVFILLILAGRAFGARFGLLLGLLTIALSSLVWGGIGPWTPFQMFACAWVGAGAGLLPKRMPRAVEIVVLCVYGIVASYLFGLIMNMWFWPFAIGGSSGISYEPGAPIWQNLASFALYSLVTSSLTWDTLRAVTTVVGVVVVGRAVLAALRRAKPVG